MVEKLLEEIVKEINNINERIRAIEKEQRLIREDILSGEPNLRMRKRILENPKKYDKIGKELKQKTKEIIGTCVSIGVTVEGKKPQEIQKAIDEGEHDTRFQS